MIVVVMGVSGSGKSTIGRQLADRLGCGFSDADQFHSPANIEKMKHGHALNDDDRKPWLAAIRDAIVARRAAGQHHVFACSALRERYREVLGDHDGDVVFVYLKGGAEVIGERLASRTGHFFDPVLLQSQFETLEEPRDALVIDIRESPEHIVATLLHKLSACPGGAGIAAAAGISPSP
ncbi:gluconate kinase [Pandoraea terrae]|uniref:Gluconokinase n=1 Tax=Pandoraea terrae TaxID=1537710 RepID=A0A5E4U0M1_9BURK|nr:gluconokinase [Pandoraea terrae]VVD93630.1 gluconate kinase [Pandoraea terrae]